MVVYRAALPAPAPVRRRRRRCSFVPYAVGYVELPGEIIVESRIEVSDPAHLRIGMPMRLVLEAYRHDSDGTAVMTYAFRPANEQQP